MNGRILVVEDERAALHSLTVMLGDEGYDVLAAEDAESGLEMALREEPDLALLDIRLPRMDGLTMLQRLRDGYSETAVIVMTADTTSSSAIRATQLGAFDYITKPVDFDHLLVLVRRALKYRALDREVRALRATQTHNVAIPAIVGHSSAMQTVYKLIGRVAGSSATVLITGESGTGKELVANAIHEYSPRSAGPLVKVNCAAIPESLLEAELFGHEKGAFTNALYRRAGRFEEAAGGTLFLDEVGELPLSLQPKLLRAIQEHTVERLGSNRPLKVDFRLVAATARDLQKAVAAGRFREDLYYRLNVVQVALPPLRERREDIPLLVQRFLRRSERPVSIRPEALDLILAHDWPGNVRELENVIARAIAIAPGGVITADCIEVREGAPLDGPSWLQQIPFEAGYKHVIGRVEEHLLRAALTRAGGNKARAAGILGIQRRLLYDKMREYRIE
ncbi:MAG: sigma-54-dependent Fis family transcriptional regulator [Bryobacteraceae bacterium]|nr:sigma-54-dependent Fis family transcriptional regulator [Bryobacteraceae bacterium]